MGNAAQVNISRWGKNLFWHRSWYTTTGGVKMFQKTQFVDALVRVLFRFGATWAVPTSPNRCWDSSLKPLYIAHKLGQFDQYYRYRQFKDDLDMVHTYRFRREIVRTFFAKTWILRYQSWIVIIVHFFRVQVRSLRASRSIYLLRENSLPTRISDYTQRYSAISAHTRALTHATVGRSQAYRF